MADLVSGRRYDGGGPRHVRLFATVGAGIGLTHERQYRVLSSWIWTAGHGASDHSAIIRNIVGEERVIPIRSSICAPHFEEEILLCVAHRHGDCGLLVYGTPPVESLIRYSQIFRNVAVRGTLPANAPPNAWEIADFSDRMHLDLGLTVALFCVPQRCRCHCYGSTPVRETAILVTAGYFPRLKQDLPDRTILRLEPSQAYRGQVARWTAISTMVTAAQTGQNGGCGMTFRRSCLDRIMFPVARISRGCFYRPRTHLCSISEASMLRCRISAARGVNMGIGSPP